MEVIDENTALLSNFEVHQLLSEIQQKLKGEKKPNKSLQNLATISYETIKYLEKSPCKDQDIESLEQFMKAIGPYNLTKAEKLQLFNHRPSTAVEIQLLIEESEERLSENQIEELLEITASNTGEEEQMTDTVYENEDDNPDNEMLE
ncbi:DNA-directed RNA polymerase III subunit RPC9-like [Tubulanus polymorphus]|uniref:DNA-directed RNA polymerase III subunit RPC9-like n=1 Tax=Tubulanus polymorphus TaxID=672921 RepID=UPI003DA36B01